MAIDLGLDNEVNAVTRSTRAIELQRNLLRLARKFSKKNIFGNVALADTGTSDGNAPVLDSNGRIDASLTPEIPANKVTSGTFLESQIPGLDASKITGEVSADRIRLDVSKIEGVIPIERIPVEKRPLSGVTAARNADPAIVARRVVDSAKADAYGPVPLFEVSGEMVGSVLEVQTTITYYVKPGSSGGDGPDDGGSEGPPAGPDPDDTDRPGDSPIGGGQ